MGGPEFFFFIFSPLSLFYFFQREEGHLPAHPAMLQFFRRFPYENHPCRQGSETLQPPCKKAT